MCRHLNCVIQEEFRTFTEYVIQKGEYDSSYSNSPSNTSPTGRYFVQCEDCNKEMVFTYSTMPKWLNKHLTEAIDNMYKNR